MFLQGELCIMNGENEKMLMEKYRDAIGHMTPHIMLKLEGRQMQMGISPDNIKKDVVKVIYLFFKNPGWE